MKPIKYIYINDVYEFTLEVIFTYNVKRSLKALYKKWDIEEEVFDCHGCTVTNEYDTTKYGLIFNLDCLTDNLISHEVLHLSAFIFDDRQIDLAGGEDDYENMAWFNGLLNDLIRQMVKDSKLNIKKCLISSKFKKI